MSMGRAQNVATRFADAVEIVYVTPISAEKSALVSAAGSEYLTAKSHGKIQKLYPSESRRNKLPAISQSEIYDWQTQSKSCIK